MVPPLVVMLPPVAATRMAPAADMPPEPISTLAPCTEIPPPAARLANATAPLAAMSMPLPAATRALLATLMRFAALLSASGAAGMEIGPPGPGSATPARSTMPFSVAVAWVAVTLPDTLSRLSVNACRLAATA